MTTIYKYPLAVTDRQTINMPLNAEILTLQAQRETPCIWALVDAEAAMEPRTFRVFGTGHPADGVESMLYVGTFQIHGGSLVFHVFEVRA